MHKVFLSASLPSYLLQAAKYGVLAGTVAFLSLSTSQATEPKSFVASLQDLEKTIRTGDDRTHQSWALESIAEAYYSIGNKVDAVRLLREVEPLSIEASRSDLRRLLMFCLIAISNMATRNQFCVWPSWLPQAVGRKCANSRRRQESFAEVSRPATGKFPPGEPR
jgi:hypothetical protein